MAGHCVLHALTCCAPVTGNTCCLCEALRFEQQPGSTLVTTMQFTACYKAPYNLLSSYDVPHGRLVYWCVWCGVQGGV